MLQRIFVTALALGILQIAFAHSFHVGLAYAEYDEESQKMYCYVQLEYADFEHWIEELNPKIVLSELLVQKDESIEWEEFSSVLLKQFQAKTNIAQVNFKLFDIEVEPNGRFYLYFVGENVEPFESITWRFSLLMGHSMQQQNKLEFLYADQHYFLYFFEQEYEATITRKIDNSKP